MNKKSKAEIERIDNPNSKADAKIVFSSKERRRSFSADLKKGIQKLGKINNQSESLPRGTEKQTKERA